MFSDVPFMFPGLSDVTLLWMTQQAQAAGVSLSLSSEVAQTSIPITPNPSQAPNTNTGLTSLLTYSGSRRVLGGGYSIGLGGVNAYVDAMAFGAAYFGIL